MDKCRQDKCCLDKCHSDIWLTEPGGYSECLARLEVAEKFVVVVVGWPRPRLGFCFSQAEQFSEIFDIATNAPICACCC